MGSIEKEPQGEQSIKILVEVFGSYLHRDIGFEDENRSVCTPPIHMEYGEDRFLDVQEAIIKAISALKTSQEAVAVLRAFKPTKMHLEMLSHEGGDVGKKATNRLNQLRDFIVQHLINKIMELPEGDANEKKIITETGEAVGRV